MSATWVVRLPASTSRISMLRLIEGIEVCQVGDVVWLRGKGGDDELDRQLRMLSGAERFELLDDGQLRPHGCRVPTGHLPAAEWTPLRQAVEVSPPIAGLSGRLPARVRLQLVRTSREVKPSILMADPVRFAEFVLNSPEVRWSHLQLAAGPDRWLVRGRPLPSLPGLRCTEQAGIAVPCGWTWSPQVDAEVLRELFGLQENDLALWEVSGQRHMIHSSEFVRITRSAVRSTVSRLKRETVSEHGDGEDASDTA